MKKDNIKVCSKCGVKPRRENHEWCLDCYREYKAKWRQNNSDHVKEYSKSYRDKHHGFWLYVILDKDKNPLYVGSSEYIKERIGSHLNGHSNIKELMQSDKWDCIKYLDVTSLVDSRMELNYLENFLIKLYGEEFDTYNTNLNIIKGISKKRMIKMFEIICSIHGELNKKFKTYITRDEFLRKQKKLSKLGA